MKIFKEKLNTATLVTIWILKNGEPILNVFHHEDDGMWEFTGTTQGVEDSDYKVVGLGTVIAHDATILEVADLPLGHRATRSSPGDPWLFSPIP